ncbi:MAG: hypothetical protein J1F03_07560 [Oscillospiraceae bacterium]|nr:hypothetical protein [Oscillospiraceae bacterium]
MLNKNRFIGTRSFIAVLLCGCLSALILSACGGEKADLVDMKKTSVDGKWAVIWEDRTYAIFCVVSKKDCGEQVGYVDGDKDDRISEYKGYPAEEWLVSWLPMDGGAMLLKEQSVTEIPDGLEAEY